MANTPQQPSPVINSLIGAGIAAAIGGAMLLCGWSQGRTAALLANMKVERIVDVVHRAETNGGDGGLVVVRGTTAPLQQPLDVPGVGPCVASAVTRTLVSHAVSGPKHELVEKRTVVQSTSDAPPFLLRDANGYAEVCPRTTGDLPLADAPKQFERMESDPSVELTLSRSGITLELNRAKERIIGLETVYRVLPVGAALTVVAHASTDARGGLVLKAGAGPFVVSKDTLSMIVAAYDEAAWWLRGCGWVSIGVAGACTAYAAWTYATAQRRSSTHDGKHTAEDPVA